MKEVKYACGCEGGTCGMGVALEVLGVVGW